MTDHIKEKLLPIVFSMKNVTVVHNIFLQVPLQSSFATNRKTSLENPKPSAAK